MRYTDDLRSEHRAIERMLNVITAMSDAEDATGKLDCEGAAQVVEFLTVFGDKCHHHKEEGFLFPALERAGVNPKESGVPVLELDHDKGRKLVRAMHNVASGASKEYTFAKNARTYVRLLTEHIKAEEEELFPLAEQRLPLDVQDALAEDFDRVEHDVIGEGRHEEFHAMLDRLEATYLRARV